MGAVQIRNFLSMAVKETFLDSVIVQFTLKGTRAGKPGFEKTKHANIFFRMYKFFYHNCDALKPKANQRLLSALFRRYDKRVLSNK